MTIAWVIGSGGLLGSALCRILSGGRIPIFQPSERFRWDSESDLAVQLEDAVKQFGVAANKAGGKWQIYWAAGVGNMSSTEEELAHESGALSRLLKLIDAEPGMKTRQGSFVLASSAGAIYAGATDDIVTESTPDAPTTTYARAKLAQENLVSEFAAARGNVTALLARLSTLYGPGQSAGKRQGLITLIARRILRGQPIQIYVSLDTIRDYIIADDAASAIVATVDALKDRPGTVKKIIAAENATTIAEIVSTFKRIARRSPRIISVASELSGLYARRVQFRSSVYPARERLPKTTLLAGIVQVMTAERREFIRSHN